MRFASPSFLCRRTDAGGKRSCRDISLEKEDTISQGSRLNKTEEIKINGAAALAGRILPKLSSESDCGLRFTGGSAPARQKRRNQCDLEASLDN